MIVKINNLKEKIETVKYTVTFSNANDINLDASYVTLNGFTANVAVSGSGDTRTVTLSNVQGTAGKKSIAIKGGAATNSTVKSLATPNSVSFTLKEKVVSTPSVPSTPTTSGTTSKLDSEPNTGVERLPVLPIMGSAVTVLTAVGYVVTKRIYG